MGFVPSVPVAFLMLFITMFCWSSWANALKKCGNWRFEGFYWDFAWSIIFWTLILSIILGGFNQTNWSTTYFLNNLKQASLIGISLATFAGFVWGLGNILLVVAMVLAGFTVAFPLALGLALVVGTSLAFLTNPSATKHPLFLFFGLIIVTLAVIANGLAYKTKEKKSPKKKSLKRGIIISIICGLLISLFPFPFNYAFKLGLNGYEGALFMTIGGFFATAILLPILMQNPLIPNQPKIGMSEYLRAKKSWHIWAIIAGLIWSIGTICNLVVAAQPNFSVAIAYTLGQCAPMVAALWGIFVWKEFKGAPKSAYIYLTIMFILFIGGIISLANATR